MKPPRHADRFGNRRFCAATRGTLACALLAATGIGLAQTTAPVGVTKPAEYECSGLEGVALSNCKDLNAASANSAATPKATPPANATHDCSDMTGSALATCLELNGQKATPARAATDNGSAVQSPPGNGQTGSTGSPAGSDANSIAPRGMNSGNAGAAGTPPGATTPPSAPPPAATTPPSGGLPANPTVPGSRMN
jgi:hypothetical protein